MSTETELLHREIVREIVTQLGFVESNAPAQITQSQASQVLGVLPNTLCNWRATGRYALPFVKAGRLVRYRVTDLAIWIAKRRTCAEG
jgi:hypothetical protein